MNSEEFIQCLKEALVGKVSDQIIQDNVSYYRSYISKKMSEGVSENAILESLGDPRLLAKTIVQSNSFSEDHIRDEERNWDNSANTNKNIQYNNVLHLPGFVVGILLVLVMMVVIGLAFCMLRFLGPVIIIGLLVAVVYRFIKKYIE